jgi:hypothetical protein
MRPTGGSTDVPEVVRADAQSTRKLNAALES